MISSKTAACELRLLCDL